MVPTVWKKAFGLVKTTKEDSRQLALELWPHLADDLARKKDEGRAEACLISRWGVMSVNGRFDSPGKVRSAKRTAAVDVADEIEE